MRQVTAGTTVKVEILCAEEDVVNCQHHSKPAGVVPPEKRVTCLRPNGSDYSREDRRRLAVRNYLPILRQGIEPLPRKAEHSESKASTLRREVMFSTETIVTLQYAQRKTVHNGYWYS